MKLRVSNFVFPLSFYIIDEQSNTLVINDIAYNIPNGNYTATTLLTAVKALLPNTFNITYDSIRNQYIFTNTSAFTINETSSCLVLLGFTEEMDHVSVGNSLTSDSVINLSGQYNMLYVSVPNIRTGNISSVTGRRSSIVKSIPVSSNIGSVMFYEDTTSTFCNLYEEVLQYINIRILGEDMLTSVNFQGQEWNMTLEVSFVKNEDQYKNFTSMVKEITQEVPQTPETEPTR